MTRDRQPLTPEGLAPSPSAETLPVDSFTRYASRRHAPTSRISLRDCLFAFAFVALFALAHLDLILWGAYP